MSCFGIDEKFEVSYSGLVDTGMYNCITYPIMASESGELEFFTNYRMEANSGYHVCKTFSISVNAIFSPSSLLSVSPILVAFLITAGPVTTRSA